MSEEKQKEQDYQQQENLNTTYQEDISQNKFIQTQSTGSSSTSTRPGSLFVQAYARVAPKQQASSNRLLAEYAKFLVQSIRDSPDSEPQARALQSAVQLADKQNTLVNWDFLEEVLEILQNNKSLDTETTADSVRKIKDIVSIEQDWTVPSFSDQNTMSFSGIAERIPNVSSLRIASILAEVGPSCTRSAATFRDVLTEISQTNGDITDAAIASIIYFFSDKHGTDAAEKSSTGLSSALLGSFLQGRSQETGSNGWDLKSVAQVLSEDYANRDWAAVAEKWDFPEFVVMDANQFRTLLELYSAGAKAQPPLAAFTREWNNTSGQLSVIEAMMAVPANVFLVTLDDEEALDAATAPPPNAALPNPQCWASLAILRRLLQLSDVASLFRRVRDLFVKCLLSCPEVLLCSLVRLQLRAANAASQGEPDAAVNAGLQLKGDVMRELIPLFFKPNAPRRVQNGAAALRRLYAISPTTVTAACFEAWRSTSGDTAQVRLATIIHIISIARLLPSPTEAVASLLNGNKDAEFSIAVAFVMADNDYLQLKPWLGEKLSSKTSALTFAVSLVSYLRKTYSTATPRGGSEGKGAPLVSLENVVTSLQLLQSLDQSLLSQSVGNGQAGGALTLGDNVQALSDTVLRSYPSLRSSFQGQTVANKPANQPTNPSATSEDVEEMATQYFQKIYTSEQSIGEVVEMLKRFKASSNTKENEIFACMVHNLFDEYRFFSKYPEKELRITGILFGALIQEQLVSSITLGIALRYVLEALRKPPSSPGTTTSSGKMFKFGMFALEQFKGRLHEWPQYCSHIVQIPHLKEGYADLVAEIEREMAKGQTRSSTPGAVEPVMVSKDENVGLGQPRSQPTSDMPTTVLAMEGKPLIAEFGPNLGRAVTSITDEDAEFEAPQDSVLDRVQFLVNNLAPSNVEKKAQELKDMLDPKYFDWLGHFLVVKRISTQANFHSLYLSLLDNLGDYGKGLIEAILGSVYRNIGKLLRSPKITTSSSERSYLKNLGIFLGQITLSRNRPILQIMLDCKELLLQGYETGKLIAVAPFLAKTLEGAKNSKIFRPPNPWLMGILGVFRSVYNVDGLKMNIKFEVEVLCKNLSIKLEDIPLRDEVLARRIAPVKEKNPDFNIKASQKVTPARMLGSPEAQSLGLSMPARTQSGDDIVRPGTDQQDTVIPNLASYVTVSPSLSQLVQSQGGPALTNLTTAALKRWVPVSVDRAIREIIQPVVERSVTIACITTKEIVSKDFAMESDENKVRKAGQLMVANLAGSLALVTCREPLRSSICTHLRQLLTSNVARSEKLSEQEQNVMEQCVQMCSTDNLELGCMLIEKAATEKAVRDVDEALSAAISARRKHRDQTGQPFYDMSIFSDGNQRYPAALPEPLRPKPGGLRSEHFQLYDSFQKLPRQAQNAAVSGGPASSAFMTPRSATPTGMGSTEPSTQLKQGAVQQLSTDALTALASKLDSSISALLSAAGTRAPEVKLSMLPNEHQIRQLLGAVKQVMPNASPSGGVSRPLTQAEQEMVLGFSQGIFKRLYELSLSEPLRLEALVMLLENINVFCPKLGKDMGTWATYAPTNTETQRRLHRTVLLLLVRSHLLSVYDLDNFLAARADNGRNHIWVEFSLLFIRTAFLERIATASDFPKIMDLMARIADGTSLASSQIIQNYRNAILVILEETRGKIAPKDQQPAPVNILRSGSVDSSDQPSVAMSSSLSEESLSNLSAGPRKVAEAVELLVRNNPTNAKQQITALLDNWIKLKSEGGGNEKLVLQYLQILHRYGLGKSEEVTERFLRIGTLVVVEAVLKAGTITDVDGKRAFNYTFIDLYSNLLLVLFKHLNTGTSSSQVNAQRLGMLNRILGVIVRSMMWHHEKKKTDNQSWDQRPWYRLFLNLLVDINKPDPSLDSIRSAILSVFAAAFHVCQPLAMPAFVFSWLDLVSHRHFMPNLMLLPNQKGWNTMHQLLIDHLLFLEPHLRHVQMTSPIKKIYEGTLRVVLVLLHDFPSFLAGHHLSFCNVIPETCVQLRNVILSATPSGMSPPDPFTPNLKIDLLPEISQSPSIMSNVFGPMEGFRGHLDSFLKDSQRRSFLNGILHSLCINGTSDISIPKVNSLVLYLGAHALARLQNQKITLSHTPEIEIIQKLMEFDDRGRYICLNAIANQLRFPSSHTHYFSCVMLYLFSESTSVAVKEQVTRVLLERLIVNRPHPWGLLITFIELIKNQRYGFWNYPFTRCATEIEKVFESVARSCMPPGQQRSTLVGGDDQ